MSASEFATYEYKIINLASDRLAMQEQLNQYGASGWFLANIFCDMAILSRVVMPYYLKSDWEQNWKATESENNECS